MTDKRLPEPSLQHEIRRDGHLVARVDLAVVRWRGRPVRLAIEHDGFAYHSDRSAFRKDRFRRNAIERAGWALLELTYEDVLYNRSRSADLIFATLQERWQADRASSEASGEGARQAGKVRRAVQSNTVNGLIACP